MIDFQSQSWHEIRRWAEQNLTLAREKNDDPTLSENQTSALRGEIRILKHLLSLPEQAKAQQTLG